MTQHATKSNGMSNLVPFDGWLKALSLDRSTGYRYRQRGILKVVNVFGRLYITRDEVARFEKRAISGEFAQKQRKPLAVRSSDITNETDRRPSHEPLTISNT